MISSIRRHHYFRKKRKVKKYYSGWPSKSEKAAGKVANTACLCSCYMCGNQRRRKRWIQTIEVFDQNGVKTIERKMMTSPTKARLTRQELMKTIGFELEAEGLNQFN